MNLNVENPDRRSLYSQLPSYQPLLTRAAKNTKIITPKQAQEKRYQKKKSHTVCLHQVGMRFEKRENEENLGAFFHKFLLQSTIIKEALYWL